MSNSVDTIARVRFGTKAETLERLRDKLSTAQILPATFFTVLEWETEASKILDQLDSSGWLTEPVIVRSSSGQEDSLHSSQAGHFLSILSVVGREALRSAINQVILSYGQDVKETDQILIQPMLSKVNASGVAFSRDPNTGSFYRVINLDDRSSSTDMVTSGSTNTLRTFYCLKGGAVDHLPDYVQGVLRLVEELENLFGSTPLDIEFAVVGPELFLLQCRPLCMPNIHDRDIRPHLDRIAEKVTVLSQPHPYLFGRRSVFGVMPDWNPAEIIGLRPKPLALSLYQELITDSIWAYQRDNYGYKNLRSFPLLVSLGGQPYIDVRVDFNSFIPADLDADLGERLVNYYIDTLVSRPSDHDKVEFAVLYTCYTFDLPDRITSLHAAGFSRADCDNLLDSLRSLTNTIVRQKEGLWERDIKKIERLKQRQAAVLQSDLDLCSKIYWLLEDCKRYGTLPFAGLARAGFIAVQMLKSLVSCDVLTQSEHDQFMMSLNTVSGQMNQDFATLDKPAFLEKYGHLRPGTYDILSPRYDQEADRYFDWSNKPVPRHSGGDDFSLGLRKLRRIEQLLDEHHLDHSILGFFDFIRSAIEGREFSKFVFTRSLSDALLLFEQLGKQHGFSAEECSYASIHLLKGAYSSSADLKAMLSDAIERGRRNYETTCSLRLPPLIVDRNDIFAFEVPACEPNFITQQVATGAVSNLSFPADQLKGTIVFIPNADPGYDWIFCKEIAGLVTMYGGVNSHMAIRSGELGIPAVIGAGEVLFAQWAAASFLQIDCRNRQVNRLR